MIWPVKSTGRLAGWGVGTLGEALRAPAFSGN